MLAKVLFCRLLTTSTRRVTNVQWTAKCFASTSINMIQTNERVMLDKALFNYTPLKDIASASVSEQISRLRPFFVPAVPQPNMTTPPVNKVVEELELTSVLRKRRLKMNNHKHKKLRKRTRALRKKLGK